MAAARVSQVVAAKRRVGVIYGLLSSVVRLVLVVVAVRPVRARIILMREDML